jgi:NAD(P)-dependent dehydrogenase (short-subunit alcohol dehydrogenase family)
MDPALCSADDGCRMARHLRLVTGAPPGLSYVVARSVHVRPGAPYVLAACVEGGVAEVLALSGHGTYTAEEMRRKPDLAAALAAWDVGDHRLSRSEREAALAFARAVTGDPRALHPSRLSKVPGESR